VRVTVCPVRSAGTQEHRVPLREHQRSETFVNTRTIAIAALVIAVIVLLFLVL